MPAVKKSGPLLRAFLLALALPGATACVAGASQRQTASAVESGFRDLNRNGRLDPYEDPSLAPEQRADDLVARMTLEEKAGTMMHGTLPGAAGGQVGVSDQGYDLAGVRVLIADKHMTSFITRLSLAPRQFAEQNNAVQRIAAATRLGIPVTVSTDPRNHFDYVLGASARARGFSQWPEALGFGALRDPAITRRFADIARQEYRATGIHMALSPQADLATEPRWSRLTGTFGSNAALVSPLVGAYVEGFQHGDGGVARDGVMAVVKHWVGYGAAPQGFDGHNYYGRFVALDPQAFEEHVAAFRGALAADVGGVMPAYTVLKGFELAGEPLEQVAPGFNKQLLVGLLRGQLDFDGIILSDWAITNDCTPGCGDPLQPQSVSDIAMPWGVEALSQAERFAKGVDAGVDQFGGVDRPEIIVEAVRSGRLDVRRIDESVHRVMVAKFRQGLFDDPFVDPAEAARIVGNPAFVEAANDVQRRAFIVLEDNGEIAIGNGSKVFLNGIAPEAARAHGLVVVERPEDADVALFRLTAPSETLHPNHFFGSRQKEGRLDFREGDADYDALVAAAAKVPVIASVHLDRPAILTNIREKTAVLLAHFGASDDALLDVMLKRSLAEGRLPFELPASMEAVEHQDPARPDDSHAPLYPFGGGVVHRSVVGDEQAGRNPG